MTYTPIIGMEVHIQLKTKSKMFCSCKTVFDTQEANTSICPICLAHPGTLPVPNKEAIIATVRMSKALGCTIQETSHFDRKHYFYPDLPKGYQISQDTHPIGEHGTMVLEFFLEENIRDTARIYIRRVHLEEDTAKLLHDTNGNSLVDYNRAGSSLMEIVTDPDFKTAAEAKKYCQELRTLCRYLDISDADMEKGHMRCEANVSVQEAGQFEITDGVVRPLGDYVLKNKVEIKNINSFKAIEKAILYEIGRQTALLEKQESWDQETRGWDEYTEETVLQRKKGAAKDYRYFTEPDIPPFHPATLAGTIHLPELPQAKRERFHTEYGFSYGDAHMLTTSPAWANFTESVMTELKDWIQSLQEKPGEIATNDEQYASLAKLAGGWMTSKLMGVLNDKGLGITDIPFSPENFAELIALMSEGRVNATNGYKILLIMVGSDVNKDPTHILEEKGWGQISNEDTLREVVTRTLESYQEQVTEYKQGKESVLKFLIGMVMKSTEGSADPQVVEKLLKETLQ